MGVTSVDFQRACLPTRCGERDLARSHRHGTRPTILEGHHRPVAKVTPSFADVEIPAREGVAAEDKEKDEKEEKEEKGADRSRQEMEK